MKFSRILVAGAVAVCSWACQDSPTEKKDNGLQEVRLDEKVSNADIIRNPVSAQQPADTVNVPKISFDTKDYDFGTIKEGAVVKRVFKFTNTGKKALVITNIQTSCGCTVPEWNKGSILPGQTDEIKVSFDSKDKGGYVVKAITVLANTFPSETVLTLRGTVNEK